MALPLVSERSQAQKWPSTDGISKLLELVSTEDAAMYLKQRFNERAIACGMGVDAEVINVEIDRLIDYTTLREEEYTKAWSGDTNIASEFESYQHTLENHMIQAVPPQVVDFDYAISDAVELIRGYSSANKQVTGDTEAALDKLFNAWLVSQQWLCEKGVIYERDKQGQILKDTFGHPKKADAQALKARIVDEALGFQTYIEKKDSGLKVNLSEQPFPTQTAQFE